MKPIDARGQLVEALRLDLVGPDYGSMLEHEVLPQATGDAGHRIM